MKKFNLAYFVSHPIQYQIPMLREVSKHTNIDLNVFFQSDISTKNFKDEGFGIEIKWDIDLLQGYEFEFLKVLKQRKNTLSFFNPINFGVLSILKRKKWDAVWFHGYNHHSILWAIFLCKILKIPFFMRMESNLIVSPKGNWIKDWFIKFIVNHSSGLLYIGNANKNYYLSYGANKKKLFSVPYTVDNNFFQKLSKKNDNLINSEKKKIGINKDLPVILFASKFIKRKNPLQLLDAFIRLYEHKKHIDSYLLFIGDGELKSVLVDKIEKFNLSHNVKILGFKNQTELPLYYKLCDIFVLPSFKEPYGLVINEVLNCKKPVITSNEVGSSFDLVFHNKNGYIYDAKNIEELSSCLKKLLNDRNLAMSMGNSSFEIINRWSFKEDVDGILQALSSLNKS